MSSIRVLLLQTVVSSIPAVLTSGIIPLLFLGSHYGMGMVGAAFFLIRLSFVLGSVLTPIMNNQIGVVRSAWLSEISNICGVLLLFLGFFYHVLTLLLLACLIKGLASGILNSTRFVWLKQLDATIQASRAFVLLQAIVQGAYGFVGLIILFAKGASIFRTILFLDMSTSLIGIALFVFVSRDAPKIINQENPIRQLTFPDFPRFKWLIVVEMLILLGMGGTNVLLASYGQSLFPNTQGYGITLTIYGACYMLVGLLLSKRISNWGNRNLLLPLVIVICCGFLVLPLPIGTTLKVITFALIFISYPLVSLLVAQYWFKHAMPHQAGSISAWRSFGGQIVNGLGELGYPHLPSDHLFRAAFFLLSGLSSQQLRLFSKKQ